MTRTPEARAGTAAEYLDRLGLRREPFAQDLDEEVFFDGAARAKRLDLLLQLAPYAKILLVKGAAGAGKTAVLRRFLRRANSAWRIARIDAARAAAPEQLFDALWAEFGLDSAPPADAEGRVGRLRAGVSSLRRGAVVPIAVIDDAHYLTVSALRLLGALTAPSEGGDEGLCAVLFAEPQIDAALADAALAGLVPQISHVFDLPALDLEETSAYIKQRLALAGGREARPFTPAVTKFIHVSSRGLPGRINEFAQVLLRGGGDAVPGPSVRAPPRRTGRRIRYAALGALALLLAGLLIFQERINTWLQGPPSADGEVALERERVASVAPVERRVEAPPPAVAETAAVAESPPPPVALTVPAAPPAVVPAPAPLEQAGAEPEVPPAVDAVALPPATPQVVAAPAAEPRPATEPMPQPAPAADARSAAEARDTRRYLGRDWLLARDPAHYTVQLMAMEEFKVRSYLENHGLEGEIALFKMRVGERELLAAVAGDYAGREEALAAGRAMSERLAGVKPWVRSFASVQAVIAGGGTLQPPARRPGKAP